MSDAEYAETGRIIARLERDASVDGRTTYAVPGLPDLFVYDDGTWQMVYAVPDESTVVIRALSHALDLPS